jgi:hypothetical protein
MGTLFGWLLSGAWEWLLGKIGMSTDQKLGRAEIENKDLAQSVKDFKNEMEIKKRPAGSDDDVVDRL